MRARTTALSPRAAVLTLGATLAIGCGVDGSSAHGSGGQGGSGANGAGGASDSSAEPSTAGQQASGGQPQIAGSGGSPAGGAAGRPGTTPSGAWSMGYYASWKASQYPIDAIEWSGLTHIAMAFYLPNQDGSLSLLGGNPEVASELVSAAHAHGVLAVASIGGADSADGFRQATASSTLEAFLTHLLALLREAGYDGIDIDWEPLEVADRPMAVQIAQRLREASPDALLTIPIGCININLSEDLSGFADLAAAYDQLNIMSYGQAGAWPGWNSWHSSALYQENSATPLAIDPTVNLYVQAGVPVSKLGLGIGFYGLCYSAPVTGPDQALGASTILAGDSVMSYANIMDLYYDPSVRYWDPVARVPYLSFAEPHDPDGCTYISYDDEESIAEKGAYLRSKGLGGVIQWELNEGYLPSAEPAERNPLLVAIREHVLN